MELTRALSFDDVLVLPAYSEVSRSEVDVSTQLTRKIRLKIPILSAAMDTVTEKQMAIAIAKEGGLGVLHRNLPVEEQVSQVKAVKAEGCLVSAAIGPKDFERADALAKAEVDVITIDTSHGHTKAVLDCIKHCKTLGTEVIAGNIVTAEAAEALVAAGADAIKIGVGPGAICTTRLVTGIGMPQFTAVVECAKASKVPVIADGGLKYSGDLTKALGAGASAVMLGSMLAGTDESPGDIVERAGRKFKKYRGMGSIGAMKLGSAGRYGQDKSKALVPEGVEALVEYKGNLHDLLFQIVGGLKGGMASTGARNISELWENAKFIEITQAGVKESHPHSLAAIEDSNYKC
ncbi:MAG: IMP dehydrogenase [Candidatus Micrarchaeota archaeon]